VPEAAQTALLGAQAPDGSFGAGEGEVTGHPEVTAACVSALLAACPGRTGAILPAVLRLVAQQRGDGAWDAAGWVPGLVATGRAVRALDAYLASPLAATPFGEGSRKAAIGARRRAQWHLGTAAVPPDPWWLAQWLGGWLAAGGDPHAPAVTSVLGELARQQSAEGGWAGGPRRRLSDGGLALHVDSGLITTAAMAGALRRLLAAVDDS
jgi:hypothetical protein